MGVKAEERSALAEKVVSDYADRTGQNLDEQPEEVVARLLADLHHYCTEREISWYDTTGRANAVYAEE